MTKSDEFFKDILLSQYRNATKEPNIIFLNFMYGLLNEEISKLSNNARIIELGSGPGVSAFFLKNKNILHTDLLSWEDSNVEIRSQIDAHSLPFQDNNFEAVFAVDTLHHLSDPITAIKEMERVLTTEGKIIFIEPFVSFLSYPIYKIFHHEETSWTFSKDGFHEVVSELAGDGDQGIPKFVFSNKKVLSELMANSNIAKIQIKLFAPFSFFATGGLSNPIHTPRQFIKFLLAIEARIPNFFMKLIASRMLITLTISK
jgi:SAM-dependent methyltransferase